MSTQQIQTGEATVEVTVTAAELRLLISAMESYVCDFGHDEADVLRACQALVRKLTAVQTAS